VSEGGGASGLWGLITVSGPEQSLTKGIEAIFKSKKKQPPYVELALAGSGALGVSTLASKTYSREQQRAQRAQLNVERKALKLGLPFPEKLPILTSGIDPFSIARAVIASGQQLYTQPLPAIPKGASVVYQQQPQQQPYPQPAPQAPGFWASVIPPALELGSNIAKIFQKQPSFPRSSITYTPGGQAMPIGSMIPLMFPTQQQSGGGGYMASGGGGWADVVGTALGAVPSVLSALGLGQAERVPQIPIPGPLGGISLPGYVPEGSFQVPGLFRTRERAVATPFMVMNPITGQPVYYAPRGRPILWSGDLAACRRVNKVAGMARRRGATRRRVGVARRCK